MGASGGKTYIIGALTGAVAEMYEEHFAVWQTAKCALASLLRYPCKACLASRVKHWAGKTTMLCQQPAAMLRCKLTSL